VIQIQMATINNTERLKGLRDKAKIVNAEAVPNQLAEKVLPIIDTEPEKLVKVRRASAANATTATIHTTSSTKDTFVIAVFISTSKDAVNDAVESSITGTPFGEGAQDLIRQKYAPSVADEISNGISFHYR